MGKYLNQTGRPILYYCEWPLYDRSFGVLVSSAFFAIVFKSLYHPTLNLVQSTKVLVLFCQLFRQCFFL